ncbi:hypothetical protein BDV27DRAFT_157777 [Aspergillus caelatus]|uniref:Uncharacterized protein n=1 Tax=Aspergillus caelatus TaxID=61420 RepID=A0A5N7A3W4_9EURO|nr:uncharacterized protein BDV27DRAFT_157777 [Aspergillus caelatus]KAE8364547.1 hypothetical protein BDV27DRAFT_157777 [Aspergillus caelatus]
MAGQTTLLEQVLQMHREHAKTLIDTVMSFRIAMRDWRVQSRLWELEFIKKNRVVTPYLKGIRRKQLRGGSVKPTDIDYFKEVPKDQDKINKWVLDQLSGQYTTKALKLENILDCGKGISSEAPIEPDSTP